MTSIPVRIEKNIRNKFKNNCLQNQNYFLKIFIAFFKSACNFAHFEKRAQLHSLNISEFIDSEEHGYLNAGKLVFQNTFWKWMC